MFHKHKVLRIVILLAAMPAVLLSSCTEDEGREVMGEKAVRLSRDTVAYDHTGQFVTIESSVDWSISLSYDGTQDGWAKVSPESGSGSVNNVMLTYSANGSGESREVALNVSFSDGELVTVTLVQTGDPNASGGDEPDPDPDDPWPGLESDPYQSGWLELPAVEDEEGRAFISHSAELSGRERRNYSMLYDAAGRIALWVAYPLCNEYIGDSGRTDAWGFDPKIPDEYEPMLNHGWPEGGFDRGHQIPSGSRTGDRSMNRQTFYYTNMTAQNSRFNQGIWANLENKVRALLSAQWIDTLYVVTGPIFDSEDPGRWRYTEDNIGNPVAVPDGYFKALLSYDVSANVYYSVAFVYDNKEYGRSNPSREDLCSVSEVEEMTGFAFFNNLPQEIAESVKSQLEPSRWGY